MEDPVSRTANSPTNGADDRDDTNSKKSNIRKRTKTGCFTCRRRRIKCDEAKPICNHCIKSKRPCDGYSTRVVFKEPFAFHGTAYGHMMDHDEAQLNEHFQNGRAAAQGNLPMIAPRPPTYDLGLQQSIAYGGQPFVRSNSLSHWDPAMNGTLHNAGHFDMNQQQQYMVGDHRFANYNDESLVGQAMPYQIAATDPQLALPYQQPQFLPTDLPTNPYRRSSAFGRIEQVHMPYIPLSQAALHEANGPQQILQNREETWAHADDSSIDGTESGDADTSSMAVCGPGAAAPIIAKRFRAPNGLHGGRPVSFHALTGSNAITDYEPTSSNSPLNNPHTAAVFWYFLNVTGPSVSMFERHSPMNGLVANGMNVPASQPLIWTHIFPVLSFRHPALLQAILALGSLQMAKLDGIPPTASMKHYHYGLKKLGRNYQRTSKRTHPITLAATLLLGFYEIWNSDHAKFTKHMWGAMCIIKEIPLRRMSSSVLARQRDKRNLERMQSQELSMMSNGPPGGLILGDDEVDLDLVGQLTGRAADFSDDTWLYTERDLEKFESLRDLFWWYCKMDCYQSFLGGTPLLLDYKHWVSCIPRSPIGCSESSYGTFDHLVLLMGRLGSFIASDLKRKRRARERDSVPTVSSPSMFPGMFPAGGHFMPPPGFKPPPPPTVESVDEDDYDLDEHTRAALQEWTEIRHGFKLFRSCLGPEFDPLGPDLRPVIHSPFGVAQVYRTYSIAGIWLNLNMAMLVLYRAHPSMPPFAMVAARTQAEKTAPYALQIGRITAGLSMGCANAITVTTAVAAALIEATFPLFVAGVQFQDNLQRQWIIAQLQQISRLTGWGTGVQIAKGCEGAWIKSYEMGVGPEYIPLPTDDDDTPDAIFGSGNGSIKTVSGGRRIDEAIREHDEAVREQGEDGGNASNNNNSGGSGSNNNNNHNKRIVLSNSHRTHLAFGIISVEQDMERLDLQG